MTFSRLTPDDPTAWSRAARPLLRQWMSSWSGSVLLHGGAMYCFVAAAQSGPQAWPVVRGRASVASAPTLDSRAGGMLARVAEVTEPITIETPTPESPEPLKTPTLDHLVMSELKHQSATNDTKAVLEKEFAKIVRQLTRQATEQAESRQIIARAERPSVREDELNRPLKPDTTESRETSEPSTDAGQAAQTGNAEQDSKAATGSTASRGADENEQPIKLASNPDPEYPEEAKAARLQGRVVLLIRVGVDGRVESLKLSRSSGVKSMDESALKTVKDWRFEPAKRFGRPIAMEIRHAIRFEFQEE